MEKGRSRGCKCDGDVHIQIGMWPSIRYDLKRLRGVAVDGNRVYIWAGWHEG